MPSSSLIVPEKPRTPPSPTWRWPPRPARLRPEPRRAASAWPSTISCSGSKKSSETRPSFPDPRYSDGRSRDQGTREPGNHANQGTGDQGPGGTFHHARNILSLLASHLSTSQRLEQISAWAWELAHTTTGGPVRAAGVFPGGSSWGWPRAAPSLW